MITAAEPIYISRLALQSNPFSAEFSAAGLYLGGEVKQRLDLLQHLLRANDRIQLLVSRCLQAFGAPQESIFGSNNLQVLQQRLQQLQNLNIRPVVLIDDVSKLADRVREQLKSWLDWQQNGHYLWRAV